MELVSTNKRSCFCMQHGLQKLKMPYPVLWLNLEETSPKWWCEQGCRTLTQVGLLQLSGTFTLWWKPGFFLQTVWGKKWQQVSFWNISEDIGLCFLQGSCWMGWMMALLIKLKRAEKPWSAAFLLPYRWDDAVSDFGLCCCRVFRDSERNSSVRCWQHLYWVGAKHSLFLFHVQSRKPGLLLLFSAVSQQTNPWVSVNLTSAEGGDYSH